MHVSESLLWELGDPFCFLLYLFYCIFIVLRRDSEPFFIWIFLAKVFPVLSPLFRSDHSRLLHGFHVCAEMRIFQFLPQMLQTEIHEQILLRLSRLYIKNNISVKIGVFFIFIFIFVTVPISGISKFWVFLRVQCIYFSCLNGI